MKRFITYFLILSAGLILAASCKKNDPPVFDDSRAFVAFDQAAVTFAEATVKPNGDIIPLEKTVKVPVTLGSLKGITETVKFFIAEKDEKGNPLYRDLIDPEGDKDDPANWIDKTAHGSINYNLKTTSGTLSFDADHRTQYIELEILYNPDYTGDYKFDLVLYKPESVALGFNKICTVTISDVNHPLTDLLGDYVAVGDNGSGAPKTYDLTLYKDDTDDHMVWFFNLFANPGWADFDTMYYGIVDDDLTTITIEFGQKSEYVYSNGNAVTLLGMTPEGEGVDEGKTVAKILKDEESGKIKGIDFGEEYGFWGYIEGAGTVGYVFPQVIATKI